MRVDNWPPPPLIANPHSRPGSAFSPVLQAADTARCAASGERGERQERVWRSMADGFRNEGVADRSSAPK
jgi:hypothetical protein